MDAVLFDLDGVLVDSRAAISGAMNHALLANGFPPRPAAELHRFIGPPLALGFAELTGHPVQSDAVVGCVAAYRERYAVTSLTETEVVAGIPEALDALRRGGHRLAVATSKALALAEPLLAALGVREHFTVIAGPELGSALEDKTATVGAALHALRARGGAMVGDTAFDMVAARAHGLRAVGVTWGIGTGRQLRDAGADVLVAAPADLVAALSPWPARP
jgi:phosphoglycolate phosphatase